MKRSKKILLAVLAIGVAGSIIIAGSTSGRQSKAGPDAGAPVAVEVTPVSIATLTQTVEAVGTISAMKDVIVSSETVGKIVGVFVKPGDHVHAGQLLVQVDDELKAIAVDQAQAQLQAGETNERKGRKDFERAESLHSTRDISDAELESYRLAFRSAEAQKASAEAALRFAQRQLSDTKIKAPISGFIASRNVDLGERVDVGKPIANIVDLSSLKVKLSIPEEEIVKLRLNQPAALHIDSAPDIEFTGTVYSIGSKTETPMGHTYPVEVVVVNKNLDLLKAGMFARVSVKANTVRNALAISKESLVSDDARQVVFVVENGRAAARPVKLGIQTGNLVQVVSGLKEGDLVISFGQKNLKDGSPVRFDRTNRRGQAS